MTKSYADYLKQKIIQADAEAKKYRLDFGRAGQIARANQEHWHNKFRLALTVS